MADLPQILEQLASGLLTGGTAALTTVLGAFRAMRTRIKALEDRLGQPSPHASGVFRSIESVEETMAELAEAVGKLQKNIEEWEDEPPDWVVRMVTRARSSTSVNMEVQQEFETRMELRLRTLQDRLIRELEDTKKELDALKKEFRDRSDLYVARDTYLQDSRRRADELSGIKESLASANGLLRGVLGALGLIGSDKDNGRR